MYDVFASASVTDENHNTLSLDRDKLLRVTGFRDAEDNLVTYKAGGGAKRGDVNMDNEVNLTDALVVLHLLSGLGNVGTDIAGYLESQQDVLFLLGLSEVIYILQYIADLR